MDERVEALKVLSQMLDEGKLNQNEFDRLKAEILGPSRASDPDLTSAAPETKTTPDDTNLTSAPGGDAHQAAIESNLEPVDPGWYPDPFRPTTHARFFNGEDYVGDPKKRREPGWYPNPGSTGRRLFDGLNWTQQVRQEDGTFIEHPIAKERARPSGNRTPTTYKVSLGLGIASLFLGGTFGLLAWVTVFISGLALLNESTRHRRWMPWVGLGSGITYSIVNAYLNGHLAGLV